MSVCVFVYFKSVGCAAAAWIAGVCIDADHFFDHFMNHRITFNLEEIYRTAEETNLKKIYLLFHSFELLIILWAVIYVYDLGDLWKAAAIGMTSHLVLDAVTNPVRPFSYFLTYRLMSRFDKQAFIQPEKYLRYMEQKRRRSAWPS